jgi:hypothetical protein
MFVICLYLEPRRTMSYLKQHQTLVVLFPSYRYKFQIKPRLLYAEISVKWILRQTELPRDVVVGISNLSSGGGCIWNSFLYLRSGM